MTETTASDARKPRAGRHRKKERRLSAILRELESRPEERISIYDIAAAFGDRAFSAIMLVFGLLTMAAIVPGSSIITGAPLFLVAAQMVAGRKTLWLPEKLGNRTVAPSDISRLNARFLKFLRRMERLLQPRLPILFAPMSIRVLGLVCFVLSAIIVLPIPLGNLAPGFSIAIIALAILTRDGLAAIAGVAMAIGSIIFLIIAYGAVIALFLHWIGVAGGPPPPPGMDGGGPGHGSGPGGSPRP
ncbi:MAG: exopolysaccharide biosynthesis protein [Bauldia sp.]|nr:exopolysaccharide biosynthesis protein [Bauldia sp.]